MKTKFTRISLWVAILLVSCSQLALASSNHTSTAIAKVGTTGAGTVYVGAPSGGTSGSWSDSESKATKTEKTSSDPTHTYSYQVKTSEGYTFDGWYYNSSKESSAPTYSKGVKATESGNTYTLTAKWNGIAYTIAFDGNGSTGGSMDNMAMVYGTAQYLTTNGFTRAYEVKFNANGGSCNKESITWTYTFANWKDNETGNTYKDKVSVENLTKTANKTITLTAVWTDPTAQKLPKATRSDYVFEGWYDGDTKVGDADAEYIATKAVELKAKWTEITDPEVTDEPSNAQAIYNGGDQALINAGTVIGGQLLYSVDGGDFSTSLPVATTPGTYYVSYLVEGDKYHHSLDPQQIEATISKAALTIKAANETVTYGDEAPAYSPEYEGFVGGEDASVLSGTLAYSCAYAAGKGVGDYAITPSGVSANNYDITFTDGKLTVGKAALTVTAADKEVTFGDPAPEYSVNYSEFVGSDDATALTGTLAYDCDYQAGSNVGEYDIKPSGLDADNYSITFQPGKLVVKKADVTFVTVPAGIDNLAYTGSAQDLITAGETNDGTITYSADGTNFTADVPQATEVGDYTVYYKVTADGNHNDLDAQQITVSIAKARAKVTGDPVGIEGLVYDGTSHALINVEQASAEGGTLVYSLDGGDYSTDVPEAINAGIHIVSYYVEADETHSNTLVQTIEVVIAKIDAVLNEAPTAATNLAYTGSPIDLLATTGAAEGGEVVFALNGGEFTTAMPTATDAGFYTVYYKVAGDGNHNDIAGSQLSVYIATVDAELTAAPVGKEGLVYDGMEHELLESLGTAKGGTIKYSMDGRTFTKNMPVATNAGDHKVYYAVSADDNHNDIDPTFLIVTIAKIDAALTGTPTAAEGLIYNGQEQQLLTTPGVAYGGTMAYSLDGENYDAALPVGTNAGKYTVYYKVAGDENHNDVAAAQFDVTIAKVDASLIAPTAIETLVYTGEEQVLIAAGESEDGTVEYSLDGETYSAELPVGTDAKAYDVYYRLAGDVNHNDIDAQQITATIAKADASITAPTAIETLVYTGEPQVLVAAGETTDGTVEYSLDGENYSAELPVGIDAKEYTVYFRVMGDDNHNNLDAQQITATIAKADVEFITLPQAVAGLAADGSAQTLISAGEVNGGTIEYSLDGENYSTELPTATEIGTYTVYYRAIGDDNHNNTEPATIEARIAAGKAEVTATPQANTGLVFNGQEQALITAGEATGGEMQYSLNGEEFTTNVPVATNAGEYTVTYKVVGDENHADVAEATIVVTIAKADVELTAPTAAEGLIYNGEEQQLLATAGEVEGGTLEYSLDGETYSEELPVGIEANEYTVYYRVTGDENHNDVAPVELKVTIKDKTTAVDHAVVEVKVVKIIRNNQLFIIREGKTYTVAGVLVE